MPKGSKVGVRKECESCNEQIPVACKTCPECNHELIPEKKEIPGQPGEASIQLVDDTIEADLAADKIEKRRSVRAKRDKPDYYDALDYDSKRAKGAKGGSGQKRGGGGGAFPGRIPPGGKVRRQVGYSSYIQPTRATLTWRKVNPMDEEELAKKKGKRQNGSRREDLEEDLNFLEEIPPEKVFACAVNLAEINRKLGVVMWKPS
eukprot:GFUD01000738.1.p1 GENE.GFUD01000738.1~~GFUD01000738.1.p1  ORF type:complete len:204 (+),score=73.33 GFUD01000738.1:631-1242(+)